MQEFINGYTEFQMYEIAETGDKLQQIQARLQQLSPDELNQVYREGYVGPSSRRSNLMDKLHDGTLRPASLDSILYNIDQAAD